MYHYMSAQFVHTHFIYFFSGHVSQADIEMSNAKLIAQDDSVKREYMADGVRRLVIKV